MDRLKKIIISFLFLFVVFGVKDVKADVGHFDNFYNFLLSTNTYKNLANVSDSVVILINYSNQSPYHLYDVVMAGYKGKALVEGGKYRELQWYSALKGQNVLKIASFRRTEGKDGYEWASNVVSEENSERLYLNGAKIYLPKGQIDFKGEGLELGQNPLSKEDIKNFNWSDYGIKIYSPSKDDKIKGYTQKQSDNYKYYDTVVYGKYLSKNGLFDTVGSIETYIKNSITVTHNGITKRVGEGVGIKDFKWIVEPKDGEEARFRIVLYQGMWKTGVSDLKVSLTVKHYNGEKVNFYDVVKNVNLLSDNEGDNLYQPPVDDDEAIGGSWESDLDNTIIDPTNKPSAPDSVNPIDWIVFIVDYIVYFITSLINSLTIIINTVLEAFANLANEFTMAIGKFTQIFGMLPSPLPQLIVLSLSVLCMTTIIRLIRG